MAKGLPAAEEGYQTIDLVLPLGNSAAGRLAFTELSCTSCHAVLGDAELRAPISAHPGPMLCGDPDMSAASIANSIVSPSHQMDPELVPNPDGQLSLMGDFSHAMTIRQLTDLVAYLSEQASQSPREQPK